jgi:lysylphosphatidylglycerol synthetase-like protein (DUF2156 family)
MMKECINCGYERQPKDDEQGLIPQTECPRCGAIYEKMEKLKEKNMGAIHPDRSRWKDGKKSQQMEQKKKRPTGITILAILALIGGSFGVIGGIAAFSFSADLATGGAGVSALKRAAVVAVSAGVLNFVFAFGLWSLKPWAWTLGIVVTVLGLLISIVQGATGGNWGDRVVDIVMAIIILYYLNTSDVKEALGKA